MTTATTTSTWVIIPCGAEKAAEASPARSLYTGGMFRLALQAAEALAAEEGAEVLVLSALHGLVTLDQVLAPYDCKMGDPGSVTPERLAEQAQALGMTWDNGADVYAMLPGAYFRALDAALRTDDVYAADVYEADAGIGYQRGTAANVRRSYTAAA